MRTPSTSPSLRLRWEISLPAGSDVGIDGVVVVLAGDLDAAGRLVAHGVVPAVVPEAQLERPRAEREAHDLVPEADPEHRHVAEQAPNDLDRARHCSRVAGAVREEHAVGLAGEHVGGGGRRGHDLDLAPRGHELVEDRALDAEVVRDHVEPGVGGTDRVRLGSRDVGREVAAVGAPVATRGVEERLALRGTERAGDRARGAQVPGQAPRVDPRDRRDAMPAQEAGERRRSPASSTGGARDRARSHRGNAARALRRRVR